MRMKWFFKKRLLIVDVYIFGSWVLILHFIAVNVDFFKYIIKTSQNPNPWGECRWVAKVGHPQGPKIPISSYLQNIFKNIKGLQSYLCFLTSQFSILPLLLIFLEK